MRVGVFADTHDHKDRIGQSVAEFNRLECELVLFAGDFVSPIALPPLRKLSAKLIACWGDNEGNRPGVVAGMSLCGEIGEPPFGIDIGDGCRILMTHQRDDLKDLGDANVIVFAHTHKPRIETDENNRLWINPGEASGVVFGRATIAVLETATRTAEIIELGADV